MQYDAGGPPGSFRAFGAASGLIDHHVDQARAQGLLSGDRGRGPAGESMAETVTDPREHILDAAEELAGADHVLPAGQDLSAQQRAIADGLADTGAGPGAGEGDRKGGATGTGAR